MTSADQAKQNYETRPYPGLDLAEITRKGQSIPPLKWMQAIGRPGRPQPDRVLVAGCGTGAEAFVMRRRLPKAEIVAIDFSPRSITIADRLQRSANLGKAITFRVADLTSSGVAQVIGKNFDLITCHGVLSYILQPDQVLKSLAACLRPDGALYLGVNGENHPATRLRPWLTRFGLEVNQMKDERRLRELLGLWDSLHDDGIGELAYMSASYLASDICGVHFNNWSLARWRSEANRVGWEVAGSMLLPPSLRLISERNHDRILYPAGVGELAERLDQTRPASFHRLLLCPKTADDPNPFKGSECEQNLRWTGLYKLHMTVPKTAEKKVFAVFKSRTLNLEFATELTKQQAFLVARLSEEASPMVGWGRSEAARQILWLWVNMGVVWWEPLRSEGGAKRI